MPCLYFIWYYFYIVNKTFIGLFVCYKSCLVGLFICYKSYLVIVFIFCIIILSIWCSSNSNRSAAFLHLVKLNKALSDADATITLNPQWEKVCANIFLLRKHVNDEQKKMLITSSKSKGISFFLLFIIIFDFLFYSNIVGVGIF